MTLGASTEKCEYYVNVSPSQVVLVQEHNDEKLSTYTNVGRKLTTAGWSTVSVDVEGAAGARTVTVQVDGTKGIDKQPVDAICQNAGSILNAVIGIYCVDAGTSSNVDISYDDALLRVR